MVGDLLDTLAFAAGRVRAHLRTASESHTPKSVVTATLFLPESAPLIPAR